MKITVNGKSQELNQSDLILFELLKLNEVKSPEMVSVQVNGTFVAKDKYKETSIKDNDEIEFIYFMGGGQRNISCRSNIL